MDTERQFTIKGTLNRVGAIRVAILVVNARTIGQPRKPRDPTQSYTASRLVRERSWRLAFRRDSACPLFPSVFAHTAVSPQIRLRIYVVRSDSKCGVQRKGLQCASGPNRSARLAMGREPKTRAALAELVIPPEREGWPLRREEAIPRTGSDSLRRENRTVRYPV